MAKKKQHKTNEEENHVTKVNEDENPNYRIPDTGMQGSPDVLTPDEANDDIDIEVVLENLSPEEYAREMAKFTDDEDIQDDFADRQQFNTGGENLLRHLNQYNQVSPDLSAGDIDAAWDSANQAGEEGLGGTNPTPDQNTVDDEGLAAGMTYKLEDELDSDQVNDRDRHRWELDPRSTDDENTSEDVRNLDIDVENDQEEDDNELT